MESEWITYQKFDDIELARETALVLDIHGLEYEIKDIFPSYALNIRPEDMEKVRKVLRDDESYADNDNDEADGTGEDYYLFAFKNDELLEVMANANEWSETDVLLARKILDDRGVPINQVQLQNIHEQREVELHRPAKPQVFLIICGYVMALLGGCVGIGIGWQLKNGQKTLPDGETIYMYSDSDRKHGRRIFFLGVAVIVSFLIYAIVN